ncbi:hypothetical protein MAR_017652, partial [Mya arenaria]
MSTLISNPVLRIPRVIQSIWLLHNIFDGMSTPRYCMEVSSARVTLVRSSIEYCTSVRNPYQKTRATRSRWSNAKLFVMHSTASITPVALIDVAASKYLNRRSSSTLRSKHSIQFSLYQTSFYQFKFGFFRGQYRSGMDNQPQLLRLAPWYFSRGSSPPRPSNEDLVQLREPPQVLSSAGVYSSLAVTCEPERSIFQSQRSWWYGATMKGFGMGYMKGLFAPDPEDNITE